jgi:alkylation response protein AidB-like acyl-CoA dehydrogenase
MLAFDLSEDQRLLQDTVREFAAKELRPRARELEKARAVPEGLRRSFHELGLLLVDVPEALGGMGLGAMTQVLAHEELAYGDPGAALALWNVGNLAPALVELGSAEQTRRWLAPFAAPDGWRRRGAVAWSERGKAVPDAGFATTASRDGDGWILEGEKHHVLHAGDADVIVVFAQLVGEGAAPGWKGIGAFVVERGQAGVTAGQRDAWLGLEAASAGSLSLRGCRVGAEARLVGPGDVAAQAERMWAKIGLANAARQVGLARASFDGALAYTQDRQAFGKAVAHFQAVSFDLAEMAMEVECARWMVWRAAAELDAGKPSAVTSAFMAVAHANELAWRVADDGVQLLGGAGFVQDYPAEKWMRDSKTLALCGPSDELCALAVGTRAAGQPGAYGPSLPPAAVQPVVS